MRAVAERTQRYAVAVEVLGEDLSEGAAVTTWQTRGGGAAGVGRGGRPAGPGEAEEAAAREQEARGRHEDSLAVARRCV